MISWIKKWIWLHGIIKNKNEDIQFDTIATSLLKKYQLNNCNSIKLITKKSKYIIEYVIEDNSYNSFLEQYYLDGKIRYKILTIDKRHDIITEDTFTFNSKSQEESFVLSRIFTKEKKGIACTKICVSCNPIQRFLFYLDTVPPYIKASI